MQSDEFLIMENCIFNSERINKLDLDKLDLESEQSIAHATKFLSNVECLGTLLNLEYSDRS